MARNKQLSADTLREIDQYADDKVHEVWDLTSHAQAGVEEAPTLSQIASIARLATAYSQLVNVLLTHAQLAEQGRKFEEKMKAVMEEDSRK
jgi:hypothetical protein